MAYNHSYSPQPGSSATHSQSGFSLPSPVGSANGQSQPSIGFSPSYGHYNGSNGLASAADSKQGIKRKRSSADAAHRHPSEESYTDGDGARRSAVLGTTHQRKPSPASQAEAKKRTKTQRACDKCRTKKIRCDVIPDSDPPLCAHCKQYTYDCTFFLPIQETRFKKKRQTEEDTVLRTQQSQYFPQSASQEPQEPKSESRYFGPTSIPFMINSTATLPMPMDFHSSHPRTLWSITTAGDGLIKVSHPASPSFESPLSHRLPDIRVERDIIERLINSYFTNIAPIFPVITKSEFTAYTGGPPPILLYSICLMAAILRDTPKGVFSALRRHVSTLIRSDDVLSKPTMANVQALLILSMSGDCHGTESHNLMSYAWTRTGTAIRMAQDLNLHRAEVSKENVETRRRVWAVCVVADRWYSAAFGYPQMIDLADCDVRLPTPEDQGIGYLNALTRLSIILGDVLKVIYSPSGLFSATDSILQNLLERLNLWKTHLPDELAFSGLDSNPAAGLLHVFYTCVCMIFWRVFMRISFVCPPHLQFSLSVSDWSTVLENSRSAIEWFIRHDIYWDSWFPTSYSLVSCALCQYHTWVRRKDNDAAECLRHLRDSVKKWEATAPLEDHGGRARTGEILCLLYEVTQSPQGPSSSHVMGPTVGVRERNDPNINTLVFRKDGPNSGAYVTSNPKVAAELKILPEGLIEVDTRVNSEDGSRNLKREREDSGGSDGNSYGQREYQTNQSSSSRTSIPTGSREVPLSAHPVMFGQSQNLTPSAEGVLEGVPGNLFDWGGWESWLASIGSDSLFTTNQTDGSMLPPLP